MYIFQWELLLKMLPKNIIFNLGTVIVLNEMLKLLEKKEDIGKRIHYTRLLILILLPVHFFFGFLFYTDAGSTFFILLSYLFALKIDFQNIFKSMKKINPIYIPRNHIIEKVIDELVQGKGNNMLEKILKLTEKPYTQQKDSKYFELPPSPSEEVTNTFCGT